MKWRTLKGVQIEATPYASGAGSRASNHRLHIRSVTQRENAMRTALPEVAAYVGRSRIIAFAATALIVLLAGCSGQWSRNTETPPPLFEQLSEDDLGLADQTLQKALSVAISDTTFGWRNTANGHSGTVTPKGSFRTNEGRYCRNYVETVTIARKSELYSNTACMDDSGTWKSVR